MINTKWMLILWLIFIFSPHLSFAEDEIQILTLEDCISIALKNNVDLKIQHLISEEAWARSQQMKSTRLPQLDFETSYIRFSEVMETDISENLSGLPFPIPATVLRFGDEDNYSLKFTVMQPLFSGFQISNSIKARQYQLQAAQYNEKSVQNTLVFQVKEIFYNLVNAKNVKTAAELSLTSINAHLTDLNNLYNQGMLTKNEILKAEIKKSEIELMISQADHGIELAKKTLLHLLGMDLNLQIEVKEQLSYKPFPAQQSQALEDAFGKRPELIQLVYSIKALTHVVAASKGEYFPRLSLLGNYEYGKPGLNKLENEWLGYWTVGIALKWNLWDRGNKSAKVHEAKASLEKTIQTKQKLLQAIQLDVQQALLKKKEAELRFETYQHVKRQAEENYKLVNDRFKQGLESNTEFINAETKLTKAQIDELRAIADYNITLANLERAIGNYVDEVLE